MADELTADDRAWLETPVDVQVSPDEQKWLDTMLEMKQDDLINYAVYQYGLERAPAEASSRNGLLQLILQANRAEGTGGASILRTRYRYLNELKGILPPEITVRAGGRHLYLTRGEGENMQVFNKTTEEWIPLRTLVPKGVPATPQSIAASAAPVQPSKPTVGLNLLLPLLPKMNRTQLETVALDVGIADAKDIEKYQDRQNLIDEINKLAEGVQ